MSSHIVAQSYTNRVMANRSNRAAEKEEDVRLVGHRYTLGDVIGEGSYGVVYAGQSAETGAPCAIKKLRLDSFTEGVPATAIREITLLQELKFPFIVQLVDVVSARRRLFLVFELLAEDLRQVIVRNAKAGATLPMPTIRKYTRQMLLALWHCHNSRIIHRDLKPGNILVSGDGSSVKIADFGLARSFDMQLCTLTHEVITLWYRAPEVLLGERHYTPAVDIFSVGCIVAEMISGRPLFRGESEINQLHKIFGVLGTPDETVWPGVTSMKDYSQGFPQWKARDLAELLPGLDADGVDFVAQTLRLNPKDRPSAAECLSHRWMADVSVQ